MPEHHPVDSKDDSPEYRSMVWGMTEICVGRKILPIESTATVSGEWNLMSYTDRRRWKCSAVLRFDGATIHKRLINEDGEESTEVDSVEWSINREGQLTMNRRTYHAATTEDGCLVLFNGGGGELMLAERRNP